MKKLIAPMAIVITVLLTWGCKKPQTTLAQDMIGAWVHVGRPGNVREIPTEGGRFKFRTGKHWTLVRADPMSGLVVEQFGGTYALKGNEYVETQQYADATWVKDNGKSFKFTVKVEGDTMTQVGIDNPYTLRFGNVRNRFEREQFSLPRDASTPRTGYAARAPGVVTSSAAVDAGEATGQQPRAARSAAVKWFRGRRRPERRIGY